MTTSLDLKNELRKNGLKATPARIAILQLLLPDKKPINVEEIYKKLPLEPNGLVMNRATVYRTLSSLADGGLVKKVTLGKESAYYEVASSSHHHHAICTKCGEIEDIDCMTPSYLETIEKKLNKFRKISDHAFEVYGICEQCFIK